MIEELTKVGFLAAAVAGAWFLLHWANLRAREEDFWRAAERRWWGSRKATGRR